MAALHAAAFTTPRPWTASEIARLLDSPLCFALTAPDGFLIGRAVADEAELLTLAIAASARRRGTGTALVSQFLAAARARGGYRAFLEVAADNSAALALYARAGFLPGGRRPGYYNPADGRPVDALILTRRLFD